MQYRKFGNTGVNISALGFGCMRLPEYQDEAGNWQVDQEKVNEMLMTAYELGVNYFDTAYIYPGSESALGEILEWNHARDRVYIATKLPHYLINSREGLERIEHTA